MELRSYGYGMNVLTKATALRAFTDLIHGCISAANGEEKLFKEFVLEICSFADC